MITGFGLILGDQVVYCSNDDKYPLFEIVTLIEKLLRSINPKRTWRVNNLYLETPNFDAERMIFKHVIYKQEKNLFFCVSGDFPADTKEARELLEVFHKVIIEHYGNIEELKNETKRKHFKNEMKIIIDWLIDRYEDELINSLFLKSEINQNINNNILYCGISGQGLPIISQLYSRRLLDNLDLEINMENVELLSSDISAKLATIAMNTIIRAKTYIKEIHIEDLENPNDRKIFLFGNIYNYTLDFFASGEFSLIYEIFKKLEKRLLKEEILKEVFGGQLKPYHYLHDVIKDFFHEGL